MRRWFTAIVGALVGGWFILTETPRQVSAHRPDFIGAAMITLSLASLAPAISEGNRWGWSSVTRLPYSPLRWR